MQNVASEPQFSELVDQPKLMEDDDGPPRMPTLAEAVDELASAYNVLDNALVLVLRTLKNGDATLREQSAFWIAANEMCRHVDIFKGDDEMTLTSGISDRLFDLLLLNDQFCDEER